MKSHDLLYVKDITESLKRIERCISGVSEEEFVGNEGKQAVVILNLQIIGEAASKISKELKDKPPEINWRKLSWIRNFIVHEYFSIKPETILYTAKNNLQTIKKSIQEVEKELE